MSGDLTRLKTDLNPSALRYNDLTPGRHIIRCDLDGIFEGEYVVLARPTVRTVPTENGDAISHISVRLRDVRTGLVYNHDVRHMGVLPYSAMGRVYFHATHYTLDARKVHLAGNVAHSNQHRVTQRPTPRVPRSSRTLGRLALRELRRIGSSDYFLC